MTQAMHTSSYREDLGNGLVARWSTAADIEKIAMLYGNVFRGKQDQPLNERMGKWARDLASGRHPSADATAFPIVEDTRADAVVAALVVLQQRWSYEGIEFTIGRPEAVATLDEYRNRGLVRKIFEMFHARSEQRGDMAQAITGIAYFYRQFGYEYAVDLEGGARVPFSAIPKLKDDEQEPYTLRTASLADLALLRELYERECANPLGQSFAITTPFDETWWRWVLDGQDSESGQGFTALIIHDREGHDLGYVMGSRLGWGETYGLFGFSVREGAPLTKLLPSVLRGLKAHAIATPPWRDEGKVVDRLYFVGPAEHLIQRALSKDMVSRTNPSYAWYVRVPDLPAFIQHIAPVLEKRLAASPAAGYTGEILIDFYRGGLKLGLENGRLTLIEDWKRIPWGPEPKAGFPPLVFLQMLFGRRSLDELNYAFCDVWADDEQALVLNSLFPKRPGWAMPQD